MSDLYDIDTIELAEEETKVKFDKNKFTAAIKHIHNKGKFTPEMLDDIECKELIDETCNALKSSYEDIVEEVPEELTEYLNNNVFEFSGFKTQQELTEVSSLLMGDDGNIKPYHKFEQEVTKIDDTYNRNYLYSEYHFARQSAQSAAGWHNMVKGKGDRYNIQYRSAGDDRVRPEHQLLDMTTLPESDKFWSKFYPPNGWRCRCTAVQVAKDKYPISDSDEVYSEAMEATSNPKEAIFRFNPGMDKKIYPPKHPYLPKGCGSCDGTEGDGSDKCRGCKTIKKMM